jgi:Uma2 family endonuclease
MATQPIDLLESGQYVDDSRYECLDGQLLERPKPGREHARMQQRVSGLLSAPMKEWGGEILPEWTISDGSGNWLTPDVTVSYPEAKTTKRGHLLVPAYLVVEIRSIDQTLKDLFNKREAYRRWGIPHYWLIDPIESACYECLPAITPRADTLTTDRFEVAISEIFG